MSVNHNHRTKIERKTFFDEHHERIQALMDDHDIKYGLPRRKIITESERLFGYKILGTPYFLATEPLSKSKNGCDRYFRKNPDDSIAMDNRKGRRADKRRQPRESGGK